MHVVGGNNLHANLVSKAHQKGQHFLFLVKAVVLYLYVEIFAENALKVERKLLCSLVVVA